MAAELEGPRLAPRARGKARQLVVFLHGYGADGNDLIGIGQAWQAILPRAAFVSPHAPEPCGMAPTGRQWFALTFRDPQERWRGVNAAAPMLRRGRGRLGTSSRLQVIFLSETFLTVNERLVIQSSSNSEAVSQS